jgi:hypothetical protein
MYTRAGLLRGSLSVLAAMSTLLPLSSCHSGTASSDVKTVCQILQTDTVATAAVDLLKKVSDDAFAGGLATDLVISVVQNSCDALLSRAATVVQKFFPAKPQQTRVADISNFRKLSSAADSNIAAELDNLGYQVSSGSVTTLVNELCQDLHGSRNLTPAQDIQALLPDADLRSLPALNGVTAEVTRTCSPLNNFQADSLVSNIYIYLVNNESLEETPLVITGLSWSRRAAPDTIDVTWTASYPDNVQYDLWVGYNGQWNILQNGTSQTSTQVRNIFQGHVYEFAVRAFDAAGNVSPWSYMYPCLSCA